MAGIYIFGMDMPDCGEKMIVLTSSGYVEDISGQVIQNVTAVSVPDHGRLGDDYDGLKVKYIVFKSSNGELVDDCFVLRPDKDKAAIAALNAYAGATENQVLASDIRKWLSTIIPASGG